MKFQNTILKLIYKKQNLSIEATNCQASGPVQAPHQCLCLKKCKEVNADPPSTTTTKNKIILFNVFDLNHCISPHYHFSFVKISIFFIYQMYIRKINVGVRYLSWKLIFILKLVSIILITFIRLARTIDTIKKETISISTILQNPIIRINQRMIQKIIKINLLKSNPDGWWRCYYQ